MARTARCTAIPFRSKAFVVPGVRREGAAERADRLARRNSPLRTTARHIKTKRNTDVSRT